MKKQYLLIAAGVLALLVVAVLALPFLIDVDQFRPRIEAQLTSSLGRQVRLGHLQWSLIHGDLSAADISIADDRTFSKAPFVRASSLDVGVELMPLITSRALHVRSLTLRQPEVRLLRSSAGIWNFSSLGHSSAAPVPTKTAPAKGAPRSSTAPDGQTSAAPEVSVSKLNVVDGR